METTITKNSSLQIYRFKTSHKNCVFTNRVALINKLHWDEQGYANTQLIQTVLTAVSSEIVSERLFKRYQMHPCTG